jgi:TolA-binding protein
LLFESGDHLANGISSLQKIVDKYPQSQLASYANFALGKNFAIDFKDFQKGRVRKAEIEKFNSSSQ